MIKSCILTAKTHFIRQKLGFEAGYALYYRNIYENKQTEQGSSPVTPLGEKKQIRKTYAECNSHFFPQQFEREKRRKSTVKMTLLSVSCGEEERGKALVQYTNSWNLFYIPRSLLWGHFGCGGAKHIWLPGNSSWMGAIQSNSGNNPL